MLKNSNIHMNGLFKRLQLTFYQDQSVMNNMNISLCYYTTLYLKAQFDNSHSPPTIIVSKCHNVTQFLTKTRGNALKGEQTS